jgi:Flp pilus assembly pilin Flp
MGTLRRLLAEETGQDLAEYGVALAIIAVGVAAAAALIAVDVQSLWEQGRDAIQDVVP